MSSAREADAFFAANPCDIHDLTARVEAFIAAQQAAGRMVACVTSGGTTVPLERTCVRFIDNFSRGTRGALSVEQFIKVRSRHGGPVNLIMRRCQYLTAFAALLRPSAHSLSLTCVMRAVARRMAT